MPPASSLRRAVAALCLLSLIWAYNWIVMKEGLRYAAPVEFAALRCLPGALLLFAVMAYLRRSLRPPAPLALFWLGLFQTAGFTGFASLALLAGAIGKTTVLVYAFPFWTLLIAWPVLGERIRGLQWAAITLAGAGLVLVLEPWNLTGSIASRVYAVLAGLSWALSAVIAKRWRGDPAFDLLSVTAWQMLWGGVVLWAVAWVMPAQPVMWSLEFAAILAYTLVLGTVCGWLLWLYILSHLSAGVASLSLLAVPALGVLLSRVHYGERPHAVEVAGMLLIAASLALLSWLASRDTRHAAAVKFSTVENTPQ